jgi:hypothetical protein
MAVAVTALVVLAAAIAMAAWWTLTGRRSSRVPTGGQSPRPVVALGALVEDVGGIPDPRRAVIAAWVGMERALRDHGLGREASEAPQEYLERVRPALLDDPAAAVWLARAFELARFSLHPVPEATRDDAIRALATIRRQLGAAR